MVNVNEIRVKVKKRALASWIDKLTFTHILSIWITVILLFGVLYYVAGSSSASLFNVPKGKVTGSLADALYFSFVTGTTSEFGDMFPFGAFKFVSVLEIIFGLLLFAVVTSKLVSIKQDKILGELYDLSFDEKINRLRSSLLLFRQNLDRIIGRIEEGVLKRRHTNEMSVYISSLEHTFGGVLTLVSKPAAQFVKSIDPINMELIFNSALSSLEKLHELLALMDQNKIDWKTDSILSQVNKCLLINEELFVKLNTYPALRKETIADLNSRKKDVTFLLRSKLGCTEKAEAVLERADAKPG